MLTTWSAIRLDNEELEKTGSIVPVNLLIFGCDYFRERKSSEVNFWNDMVDRLSPSFNEIVVVSVNSRDVEVEHAGRNVTIYNLPPKYFTKSQRKGADLEYSGHAFHRMPMSIVYKTMSFVSYVPRLTKIIRKHNIGIVHYMRVFGLLNERLIGMNPDLVYTITVSTHVDRGFPAHQIYHVIKNLSFSPFDKIIATAEATARRMTELKVEKERIRVIPWATDAGEEKLSDGCKTVPEKEDAKKLVLWAGPLQGTGDQEFQMAYRIAGRVTESVDGYRFVFAFKPDKMPAYIERSESGSIRVIETDREQFSNLMCSADLFLSPVVNMKRTVAPPLTWIEMMQHGVPVITTPVEGAEEIVHSNETGYLIEGEREAIALLTGLKRADMDRVKTGARKFVDEKYNVTKIANGYLGVWRELLVEKGFGARI